MADSYRIIRDCTVPTVPAPAFTGAVQVYGFMRAFAALEDTETVWALCVDSRLHLLQGPFVLARGALTRSTLDVKKVFQAVAVTMASGFFLVHNHPGGHPTPTPADDTLTTRVSSLALMHDCELYDHVIIGAGEYYSYRDARKL